MNCIGLTGGIGSGKSTVAAIFQTLGIPVYVSDQEAKRLMNQDEKLRNEITALFGQNAYTVSGELNRPWMAERVFHDKNLLHQLNQLVHPAVGHDFLKWTSQLPADTPYVLKESAILFEEYITEHLDAIILVVAPETLRIERIMHRDQVTAEQVKERMQHQWSDDKKIPLSDYIIYNDGEVALLDQVIDIHHAIRFIQNPPSPSQ